MYMHIPSKIYFRSPRGGRFFNRFYLVFLGSCSSEDWSTHPLWVMRWICGLSWRIGNSWSRGNVAASIRCPHPELKYSLKLFRLAAYKIQTMQYEQEVSQGTHFNAHIPCSVVYFSRLVKEVNETERIQHALHSLATRSCFDKTYKWSVLILTFSFSPFFFFFLFGKLNLNLESL